MKRSTLPGVVLAACAVPGALYVTASPASATTHSCPSEYACVYAGTTTSSTITYKWKTYGYHNIYHQSGRHLVVNAQTGGAFASAYSKYDAKGTELWTLEDGERGRPPSSAVKDLGPVYSFWLSPGPSCWPRCA